VGDGANANATEVSGAHIKEKKSIDGVFMVVSLRVGGLEKWCMDG
jgi:hypothetical protein